MERHSSEEIDAGRTVDDPGGGGGAEGRLEFGPACVGAAASLLAAIGIVSAVIVLGGTSESADEAVSGASAAVAEHGQAVFGAADDSSLQACEQGEAVAAKARCAPGEDGARGHSRGERGRGSKVGPSSARRRVVALSPGSGGGSQLGSGGGGGSESGSGGGSGGPGGGSGSGGPGTI